jgi:hypothetical protein
MPQKQYQHKEMTTKHKLIESATSFHQFRFFRFCTNQLTNRLRSVTTHDPVELPFIEVEKKVDEIAVNLIVIILLHLICSCRQ